MAEGQGGQAEDAADNPSVEPRRLVSAFAHGGGSAPGHGCATAAESGQHDAQEPEGNVHADSNMPQTGAVCKREERGRKGLE